MRLGIIIIPLGLLGCTTMLHANTSKIHSLPNLKLLMPLLLESADSYDAVERNQVKNNRDFLYRSPESTRPKHSFLSPHNIRQYVQNLRKYSELQVTNQLAVTVGTFKLAPLSDKQMQLIETHEAFLPRTNNVSDDAERGYGIKFRYAL
ncbi:hypothetical protein CC99x_009580 [Candidatus Berkiella cookevillensis]|uniref:Uncharacterized protein n=1 Tax=Candidatus Berkiella cookevillensis TaxID=437022 RepID=A0A0Q9YMD6_9GAMM|nr:hypothetical protein [Candidatus Berkiella cookevillensis]MCS5709155.1 hypothetical protein [Candidatus Berkiella cookevillensis]